MYFFQWSAPWRRGRADLAVTLPRTGCVNWHVARWVATIKGACATVPFFPSYPGEFFFIIGISNLYLLFINFGILCVCHWKVHFLPLLTKEFARYNLTSFVCCKEILQTFCLKKNKDITRQIHFLSRLISFRDKHTLNPFLPDRKNIFRKKICFSRKYKHFWVVIFPFSPWST